MTEVTKFEEIDPMVSAMAGKQMDKRTLNVCGSMYSFISKSVSEFSPEDGDAFKALLNSPQFDGALKSLCVLGAIGRDEVNERPTDVIDRVIVALVGEPEARDDAYKTLTDRAVANATAGINVAPWDGPEGSFPVPFSAENM